MTRDNIQLLVHRLLLPITRGEFVRAILIMQAVVAFIAVSISIWILLHPLVAEAPFRYDDRVATPLERKLCPGEPLRWKLRATVTRAPVIVQIVQVWWNAETKRAALPVVPPVYSVQRETRSFAVDAALPVPALPPGRYEYLLAAQESASSAQVQAVPFEIKEGC